jgi:hypothetical protein
MGHLRLILGSKVLTAVKMLMLVFWAVNQCGIISRYQRFGETYRLQVCIQVHTWEFSYNLFNNQHGLFLSRKCSTNDYDISSILIRNVCAVNKRVYAYYLDFICTAQY